LAEYLRANKSRLHRLTPLIEILGTIDRGRQRDLLVTYSRHPVPAVRKSALAGLYRSLGKDAEPLLLDAVKDQDPSVCQTSITLLGTSRCVIPEFIEWLHSIVISPNPTDVREEGVLVAALRALGALGNVPLTPTRQVEEVLLDRLGLAKTGWFRRGMRLENDLSPRVQEAFCSTLGSVGTEHSAQALRLFLDDGLPAVRSRAKEALDRIHARGSMRY
jgi:HEAT repeat protein